MTIRNSFRILEVEYGASMEEVKQGYKDLVRVWHPDRFTQDPRLRKKAEDKLKEINRAYSDLMDFFSRTMTLMPPSARHPVPRWGFRGFRGIGIIVERVTRRLCQQICSSVNRIEAGRICQVFFSFGAGLGAATGAKGPSGNPLDNKDMHSETDGCCNGIDFRLVFDEVARERREQSKREPPPYRG